MGRIRTPGVVATSWAGRLVRTPFTSGSSPPAAIATPAVKTARATVMARAARLRRSSMAHPSLGDMKLALLAGYARKRQLPYRMPGGRQLNTIPLLCHIHTSSTSHLLPPPATHVPDWPATALLPQPSQLGRAESSV